MWILGTSVPQRKLACDQKRALKNEGGVNKEGDSNCNADKKRMRWIQSLPVSKEYEDPNCECGGGKQTATMRYSWVEHPITKSSAARAKALERSWVGCWSTNFSSSLMVNLFVIWAVPSISNSFFHTLSLTHLTHYKLTILIGPNSREGIRH